MENWIDVEVTNEEVLIHATARLMKDGNYYIDARVGGDVLLGGMKFTIDQVVEVKLIREDNQAVEHSVQSDEKPCPLDHKELFQTGVDVCPECNEVTASRR